MFTWPTHRKTHENFGDPKRLAFPAGFHHATMPPDGRVMYLQGTLPRTAGDYSAE